MPGPPFCHATLATCVASAPPWLGSFFMWMAATLRLVTLFVFLFVDIPNMSWFYSAIYWGSRQNDAAFLEFASVRDEAHRARESWSHGELSDSLGREEALRLSAELRQWRERHPADYELFMEDFDSDESPCLPFRMSNGFFQLLEAQEHGERNDWFYCDYLLLLQNP